MEVAAAATGPRRPGPLRGLIRTLGRIAALVVPVGVAVAPLLVASGWNLNPDGALYAALATSIQTGHGYAMPEGGLPVFRPPLLATIVAASWTVGGPSIEVAVNTLRVFHVGLVLMSSLLAMRLAGAWAALLAGVLVASSPILFEGVGAAIRPDGVMAAFTVTALLLLIVADQRRSIAIALLAGLVASLAFATKQTALMLVLVPFGMAALEGIDRRRAGLWMSFLLAAGVGPLAWYTVTAASGFPLLGRDWLIALGWIAWLLVGAAVVVLRSDQAGTAPAVVTTPLRRWKSILRVLSLGVFMAGIVVFTRVGGLDLVELPLRSPDELPATLVADLADLLPSVWLLPAVLAGVAFALCAATPWRYVAIALIASLPLVGIAWWHDLRDSQYMITVALGLVLAGALPSGITAAVLRRWGGPPVARRVVAATAPVASVLCAAIVAVPMASTAASFYADAPGSQSPRYEAMVAAAAWIEGNAEAGAVIGYDAETTRQLFTELDARHPLSSAPQVYVRPDAGVSPLPLAPMAWVDKAGRQGLVPPAPVAPLIKLETAREGRHFVGLEGRQLVEWLRTGDLSYLAVTDDGSLGLADIESYLDQQPGLIRVFEHDGPYHLVIYGVSPEAIVDMEYPLFASADALELSADRLGITPDDLASLLNPGGLEPGR